MEHIRSTREEISPHPSHRKPFFCFFLFFLLLFLLHSRHGVPFGCIYISGVACADIMFDDTRKEYREVEEKEREGEGGMGRPLLV